MLLVSVKAPTLLLSYANELKEHFSASVMNQHWPRLPRKKIVSPPVFTGGLSVIYGCLEGYFLRKCNLLFRLGLQPEGHF